MGENRLRVSFNAYFGASVPKPKIMIRQWWQLHVLVCCNMVTIRSTGILLRRIISRANLYCLDAWTARKD